MSYNYDINHTQVDNKSKNCLLINNTLYTIVNLFVTTFLVAYIYSFNGDTYAYLFNVGVYNIFLYLTMALTCIPISKLVDKTNRVVIYRISLVVKAFLVVFFIFFGKELANYLILAGCLNGLGEALYVSSYNVIKQEMVSRKSIGGYASNMYILVKLVDIICPVLLGAMIDVTSYSGTAIIVLFICIIELLVSVGIKAKKPDGSNHNIREFIQLLNSKPDVKRKMKLMYFLSSIYGVSILITNLINVCIMLEYGSTLSLGIITSLISIGAILTIILVKKFTKNGYRSWLYAISSIVPIIAVIIFALNVCATTLIILNASISLTAIIYKVYFDVHRNSTLKESGLYNEIAEHQSIIEFLADSSRWMCFGLLLIISLFKSLIVFKIFMILAVVVTAGIFIFLEAFEKICRKESEIKTEINDKKM